MELVSDLAAIGFTEYEAKVYMALLRESPATGYQISKLAGVPRSMVYEALGRLNARGAVLKTDDRRATLYRPVPPDVLLDRYSQEYQKRIQNLRGSLQALFNTQQEDHFWSIKGRDSTLSYAKQMIDAAENELLLVLSDVDLEELQDRVMKADERGVAVSALLTGSGDLSCGQVAHHPPLESELHGLTDMLIVVADHKQALIANTDVETTATITGNRNLILIARQFVWMELFAQRINATIGPELLARLNPDDRRILETYTHPFTQNDED
jgi:sugar-specific transcriptional regulator TrmB